LQRIETEQVSCADIRRFWVSQGGGVLAVRDMPKNYGDAFSAKNCGHHATASMFGQGFSMNHGR
jgi:hypothetical protein